tara:strand:+ start:285 stop:2261 length:1977 start_codon:yes stop_codon:yes gene_type:complete
METEENARHISEVKETDDSYIVKFKKTNETGETVEEENSYDDQEKEDYRNFTNETYTRTFTLNRNDLNIDNRTVSLAFSSELPVERIFGNEVLDHNVDSVRLGRLNSSAPLLINHELEPVIGIVENARIDSDKVGRAVVRFGNSDKASEIFRDVKDGIRNQVSIGYRIHSMEKMEADEPSFRAVDWEPYEISLVSIPADPSVGVGRSSENTFKPPNIEREAEMDTPNVTVQEEPKIDENKLREVVQKNELNRIKEIEAYGVEHDAKDLAREYIVDGRTVPEFQSAILEKIKNYKPEKVHEIGLTEKETRSFSWMKIIRALANPSDKRLQEEASFEFDASRAQAEKSGIDPQGAWVPSDVIFGQKLDAQRDLTVGTDSAGGYTVQTDVLASSFIDILRANMVFSKVGVTELNGLNGKVSIPGSDAGSTAYWVAENGAVSESDQTFIARSLTGKTCGAMTDVARNLMLQSSIDVEAFVRNDIAKSLALEIENKGLVGNGTGNAPIGVFNTTGVGGTTITAANKPDWGDVVDIWNGVASNNALRGNLNWVGAGTITANMMKDFRNGTGSDRPILDDTAGPDGNASLMTHPYYISENNVEAGKSLLTFGDWSALVQASWGNGLDLVVDPYTNSNTGATRVVGLYLVDFAITTPKSFSCSVNP